MIRKWVYIGLGVGILALAGCSGEEPPNPEETLEDYLSSWQEHAYEEMEQQLSEESRAEIDGEAMSFSQKYEEFYEEIGVNDITVNYESRNFEEEEVDLDELEEITYPVRVEFETVIGDYDYDTDVHLMKIETEEGEEWVVDWSPEHLFVGVRSFSDSIEVTVESPSSDPSERGEMFARDGEGLAVAGNYRSIGFVYQHIEKLEEEVEQLSDIVGLEEERILQLIAPYEANPDWHAPVINVPNDHELIGDVEDANIPGVRINTPNGREYPYARMAAHLTGNITGMTADFLEDEDNDWPGYQESSFFGQNGLERVFEERFRGEIGSQVNIVDEDGNLQEVLTRTDPEKGEDVTVTIDVGIQEALYEAFGDEMGAAVAMDPVSGEVLAMVSSPAYDPNERYLRTASVTTDETFIRFNRTFSPGSVMKPLTAAIGLEEGTLDPDEVFTITGAQWQPEGSDWGNHRITRVNEDVDSVDLDAAMKHSDNIYFAMQALEIGSERMEEWSETFDFGEDIPFEYPIHHSRLSNNGLENSALLADTGYGQGEVQMSPLHLATLYTMFVNEGSIVKPLLLADEEEDVWKEGVVSAETAETVLDSMISVVQDSNGTAYRSNPGHSRSLAGKTGTAEIKDSQDDEDGDTIGWYVSVDVDDRDLLVVMMVDGASSGEVVDKVNEFYSSME
ncbi:penicillin-binding transpeptidase domain-containing protein [Alteribacter aurantiacus]|uniref:penicillin-binding transpeptidase domain-containing protein n=1 Tax=Alteribacter aurantiacus TaxID=254410 RepID=UPI0003FE3B0A|nr:penicillin-binding transpeptidase domain-containing protein [Alteribacter aurantiacus]